MSYVGGAVGEINYALSEVSGVECQAQGDRSKVKCAKSQVSGVLSEVNNAKSEVCCSKVEVSNAGVR
jgi:hypothetical protein